ncbi:MAG: hypothetical protein ACI9Z3_001556 [Roseivirga sp.]
MNSQTGAVSIDAVPDGNGSQQFTITADDGQAANNTATQTFTLTVVAVNDAPVINEVNDWEVVAGETIQIVVVTNDIDGDDLSLSASSSDLSVVPNEALTITKIDNNQFSIDITPPLGNSGTTQVMLILTDGTENVNVNSQLSVIEAQVTSIEYDLFEADISIFPNPFSDSITIQSTNGFKPTTRVIILDISGRVVLNLPIGSVSEITLKLENLKAGLYLMYIADGQRKVMRKLLKR